MVLLFLLIFINISYLKAEDSVRSLEQKAKENENILSKQVFELKLLQEHVSTLSDQVEKLRKATREAEEAKAQLSCANLRIKVFIKL